MLRTLTGVFFIALLIGTTAAPASVAEPESTRAVPGSRALDVSYRYISVGWIDWVTVQLSEAADSAESGKDLVEALLVLGLTYESSQNPDAARDAYLRLIRSDDVTESDKALAYALLGQLELRQARSSQAKAMLAEADSRLPDQASVVYGLGQVAENEGDFASAVEFYTRASTLSDEWLAPVLRTAAIHNRRGAYVEAARLLADAQVLGTRDVHFHVRLGESLQGILNAVENSSLPLLDDELVESLGIERSNLHASLIALIRHAADRALQLEPGHSAAQQLLERLPKTATP